MINLEKSRDGILLRDFLLEYIDDYKQLNNYSNITKITNIINFFESIDFDLDNIPKNYDSEENLSNLIRTRVFTRAAETGSIKIMDILLKIITDLYPYEYARSEMISEDNNSPLLHASMNGHIESVKTILKLKLKSFYRDISCFHPHFGGSALQLAANDGHIAIVNMFLYMIKERNKRLKIISDNNYFSIIWTVVNEDINSSTRIHIIARLAYEIDDRNILREIFNQIPQRVLKNACEFKPYFNEPQLVINLGGSISKLLNNNWNNKNIECAYSFAKIIATIVNSSKNLMKEFDEYIMMKIMDYLTIDDVSILSHAQKTQILNSMRIDNNRNIHFSNIPKYIANNTKEAKKIGFVERLSESRGIIVSKSK